MKWGKLFLVGILVLELLPSAGREISRLRPAELLYITEISSGFRICTDTGDLGEGMTIAEAAENLRQTAPGEVFLDTVTLVVVDEKAQESLPELRKHLRSCVRICRSEGEIDPKAAAEYLTAHMPERRLADWEAEPLKKLRWEMGRFWFEP